MNPSKRRDQRPQVSDVDARLYLAAIVESSDDAIFGKTLDGIITSWNRGAERLYGYTAEETIGRSVELLVPPEIENDVPGILERLRRGERIDHYRTLRLAKDGRRLHISLTISTIRNEAGEIVGASTIARDVTAQVEAERALEQRSRQIEALNLELRRTIAELEILRAAAKFEAERVRRLQRVTAALTAATDPDQVLGVIIDEAIDATGAYACGVIELTPDGREFITVHSRGFDPEKLRPFARFSVDRPIPVRDVARTGEPVFLGSLAEWTARYPAPPSTHDGEGSWAALPLHARGRLIGALTLNFDGAGDFAADEREYIMTLAQQCAQALDRARLLQAERRARSEAEEASRAKSNFLAVMSHELRTPLTAILGYAALLADEVTGPINAQQKDQVNRMRASGRHLLGLIDQVLSLARIEAGREDVEIQSHDAVALARVAGDMIRPLVERNGLRFVLALPDAPVQMTSDPGKVRQILLNLLSNAVKFTDRGEVRLGLQVSDGAVEFQIADTGPGISSEDRDRIFHPFEQAERGPTRLKEGTGLGLSVSLELARLLRGDLTLESRVGDGSTFTVRLPLVWEPAGAASQATL